MFSLDSFRDERFAFSLTPQSASERDRFTVIIGPNGCGKSQVLRRLTEARRSDLWMNNGTPSAILAISNLVSDSFPFASARIEGPYRYLGLRQAANNMSTGSLHDSIANSLIEYLARQSNADLAPLLSELGFDDWRLIVRRSTTKAAQAPRSRLLNDLDKAAEPRTAEVVTDLNDEMRAFGNSYTERTVIDEGRYPGFIAHLARKYGLPIPFIIRQVRRTVGLHLDVEFARSYTGVLARELSSGQAMLFSIFARIAATLETGSLILIDEPELGLHPNWQSAFIPLLRTLHPEGSGSHFFLATHSPYLVADATDVLTPGPQWGEFVEFDDPFEGRSVENILYRVFNARVAGNQMVESDLSLLITAMGNAQFDQTIEDGVLDAHRRLRGLSSPDTSTLNRVLEEFDARLAGRT